MTEDIRQGEPARNDLDAIIVPLARDRYRLATCLDLGLPQRSDGDIYRLEVGRILQPADLRQRLARLLDRVREA